MNKMKKFCENCSKELLPKPYKFKKLGEIYKVYQTTKYCNEECKFKANIRINRKYTTITIKEKNRERVMELKNLLKSSQSGKSADDVINHLFKQLEELAKFKQARIQIPKNPVKKDTINTPYIKETKEGEMKKEEIITENLFDYSIVEIECLEDTQNFGGMKAGTIFTKKYIEGRDKIGENWRGLKNYKVINMVKKESS